MPVPSLTLRNARHLHLAALGLLKKPRRKARPDDILSAISRMSLLQIDTINIVARSPYLVLFSRLGNYPQRWLDDALARGELMEYWAHEACFLPRSDFALVRHRMLSPENMGWKYRAGWMADNADEIAQLIAYIEQHGPVRSADFAHPSGKGSSGWWEWKPHKRHLEGLFTAGQVMVVERRHFQRVYDLTSRVMPDWNDTLHLPSEAKAQDMMLKNSARSLGIFRPEWLADYYRLKNIAGKALIRRWMDENIVTQVNVEKLGTLWVHNQWLPELELALQGKLTATHSAVLSPFDPLVWDRRRAEQLFNFRYRLECYTPVEKRQYGYFVLPLLHKGRLVGRMDAKMHRKTQVLEIIALYLEEGEKVTDNLSVGLGSAITEFALWQQARRVVLNQLPPELAGRWEAVWEIASSE